MEKYYGGFWIRVIASCIDTIILSVMGGILGVSLNILGLNPAEPMNQGILFGLNLLVGLFYAIGLTCIIGGTIGKRILGLQVVDAQTFERVSVSQSLIRSTMQWVSAVVAGLGYIAVGFSPKKQGWHDSVAGTVVVKDATLEKLMLEEERVPFIQDEAA